MNYDDEDIIRMLQSIDECDLSALEMDFVESVVEWVEERGGELSERQREIAERIIEERS